MMLTRLLIKERLAAATEIESFKQILVTCNNKLKLSSEQYYEKLRIVYPELEGKPKPQFFSLNDFLNFLESLLPVPFFSKERNNSNSYIFRQDEEETNVDATDQLTGLYQQRDCVSYVSFELSYFPKFHSILQTRVSPLGVWSEISSVIKGSIAAVQKVRYLTREEYISLATSRSSIFNQEDRDYIYTAYETYEKLKHSRLQWDMADLTMHLLKELPLIMDMTKIDFVYVDEVQDLTQTQIAILKYVCQNEKGFVFGGDTAQTIASGVNFRFQDIRKLFFDHFLHGPNDKKVMPKVWQLRQNFRTHSGILALSNTLVEKLFELFPFLVDKVVSETGALFQGTRPTFIFDMGGLAKTLFGSASENDLASIEMGAEQVIIVRDDEVKESLQKKIPNALVLTVFESKGMEFEDVLVYNFWKDSKFKRWRVLLGGSASSNGYHGFDEKKDFLLCSELKALYVACTRAKCQLVIVDESPIVSPAIEWWKSLGVLSVMEVTLFFKIVGIPRKSSLRQDLIS